MPWSLGIYGVLFQGEDQTMLKAIGMQYINSIDLSLKPCMY